MSFEHSAEFVEGNSGEEAHATPPTAESADKTTDVPLPHPTMPITSSRSRVLAALASLSFAVITLPAAAQLPWMASSGKPEAAADRPMAYSAEDIRKAVDTARKQLETIEAGGETPSDAPPGTPLTDILQRLTLARTLASTYEKELNSLEKAEAARKRLTEAQRANESWRGFEQSPPYSVLTVDALRDERDAAKNSLDSAHANSAMLKRLDESYGSKVKTTQGAARLAAEAADRARGTPDYPAREWASRLAALRTQVDEAIQGLLQIGLRGAQADADAAKAVEELATRKLTALGNDVAFPREELDKVLLEIETRRRTVERELASTNKAQTAAAEALAHADLRVTNARTQETSWKGPSVAELERDAAAAREVEATASQRVFLLREYLLQLDSEKVAWEARATAVNQHDPVRARAAYDRLTESLAGLRATKQYLEQQLVATENRLRDEEARQRGAGFVETPASKLTIDTLRQRQKDLRKALDDAVPLGRLVAHFRADFEDRRVASWTARVKDQWAAVQLAARDVWNFELFAIDDALETSDGRKIMVSRSVTVGKTFGAALIVLIGYLLSRFAVRRVERMLVAEGRATPQGAALVRKWILFVVAGILGLVALLSANIPLTAFAFLGGALAIAAGFGLQTLLKNLVSGVMLLIERPLRLGDLVEVDGIRGRVTEIGIRASTIRSADGLESMIPNSRFLEGTMTNWTYSSAQARQTAKIGVAYGAPLRRVVEILGDVLERHGLVLKEPKPQVYLEEYGDSSIDFSLTYWVEFSEGGDVRRVKSDILLMIDRAFEEAGISIPFPQRDVHLSTREPVPVAIVG